jgi:dihydroneopterin aldolase
VQLNPLTVRQSQRSLRQPAQLIMDQPTPLLETLVEKIASQILSEHLMSDKVFVKITKQQLYIPSFEGITSVSIEKSRE